MSVDRGNGTGVWPAKQEGVALQGGGVTWTRARRREVQNNNNNNNSSVKLKQNKSNQKMYKIITD